MKRKLRKRVGHPFLFSFVVAGVASVLVFCSSREHRNEQPIISLGTEPRQVTPREAPVDELPILDFKNSFFDFAKSSLRADAKKALRDTAKWLEAHPKVTIQIEGFCDERGSESFNLKLGQKRADVVLEYLVSAGVERERLSAISYGRMEGHRDNERAKNRRVGLIAVYPSE